MNTTIDMTPRLRLAAEYIPVRGWSQGEIQTDEGQVCLTGAIRFCAPRNGDDDIIRAVLIQRRRAEDWNDSPERTQAEVVEYLASTNITDADLAETFGLQ